MYHFTWSRCREATPRATSPFPRTPPIPYPTPMPTRSRPSTSADPSTAPSRPMWRLFRAPPPRPISLSGGCSPVASRGICLVAAPRGSNPPSRFDLQAAPLCGPHIRGSIPSCARTRRASTSIQPQSWIEPSRAPESRPQARRGRRKSATDNSIQLNSPFDQGIGGKNWGGCAGVAGGPVRWYDRPASQGRPARAAEVTYCVSLSTLLLAP